jgi:hypothetical protein
MIRHHAVLTKPAIDVGFPEFHIVHDEHFVDIAPLQIVNSFDLRLSEEIAVYGYPCGAAMLERNRRIYRKGQSSSEVGSPVSPFETCATPKLQGAGVAFVTLGEGIDCPHASRMLKTIAPGIGR